MTLDVARPSQLLQMKVLSVLKLVVHCAGRGPAYLYSVPAGEALTRMHDGSVFCTRVYLRRYLKVCVKRLDDFPHGLSCGAPKGSRRPHEGLRRRGRVCTLRRARSTASSRISARRGRRPRYRTSRFVRTSYGFLVTFTSEKRAFGSEHSPDPDCVQRARFVKFTSRLAHFAQFYLKDRLRLGPRGAIAARVRVGQLLPAGLAREDAPSNSSTPAFPQSKRVTDAALLSMLCPAGTGRRSCSRRRRRRRRSCTGR